MLMLPIEVIACPYCGEAIELIIDDSVDHQSYVEDCSVCCRPIEIEVVVDAMSNVQITCRTDSEA